MNVRHAMFHGMARASALAAILGVLAGCSSSRSKSPELLVPPERSAAPRQGVELTAQARGSLVYLSLTNYLDRPVVAGPKTFGLVAPGERSVRGFQMGVDSAQLPVKRLERGESIKGYLRFADKGDLVGHWLVFHSADSEPALARCVIQPPSADWTISPLDSAPAAPPAAGSPPVSAPAEASPAD